MTSIVVDKVSKTFRIPHEKRRTVFQHMLGLVQRRMTYEELCALDDVSFEVRRGDTLGVIGRNGSGKSTLLKVLAKVLYPDSGTVKIEGKVSPFLELGVGFQPELTAKDNVYLYSSILGITRRQVDRNYEEIMDFGELKRFENMKLKNFSSGMQVRLAFSTAVHADPDILLIDEVFAVGDADFQKKSAEKVKQFKENGKTIVFVSHDLGAVKSLCRQSVLLEHGKVVSAGDSEKVVGDYMKVMQG